MEQYFFQHRFPIQRSSITHWRKHIGDSSFELLLQESLRFAFDTKALKTNQLKHIIVDTTAQPKVAALPTELV